MSKGIHSKPHRPKSVSLNLCTLFMKLFSFEGGKDDKPKTGFEALASIVLVTITTIEIVDSNQKPYLSDMQIRIGATTPLPLSVTSSVPMVTSASPLVGTTELSRNTFIAPGVPA
ncbi:hypothetical protein ACH5RR_036980 [Cinchona calisaya]|uniref:Uncharacterized protein n=1 Tax=Cinchona calisaya TaxID=153742 RepID=A0ABD2Y677_9GENT